MLEALKTKHREIARLSFEGYKGTEIAEKTGVTLVTVYKILKDPICQAYINGLGDKVDKTALDVRERLMKLNALVLDRFEEFLEEDSKAPPAVIASIGKDVLDRTGNKAPDKININHTLQNKSDEEIDAQIAALSAQINSNYNADLTGPDGLDNDEDELDLTASQPKINPKTDCRES